ncbi:uncharacterized protein LOC129941448 [Eupeodes corollae]|uniref:uncharacterized protein LOC129941448 n=1 Tax=Eupeodes corollae TaxID=290404 RepID=UPI00249396A0|nr:uncharacterized protein LOC129941448 [Eupeodes corollae]
MAKEVPQIPTETPNALVRFFLVPTTNFNPEVIDGLIIKENQVSFTIGQRGCTLLVSNGYHYVRNRRSGYKTYWICAKKGSLKCNARVVTNIIDGVQKIVLQSLKHSHPVNVVRKKRGSPPKIKNDEEYKKTQPKRKKNARPDLFIDYGFEFID